MEKDKELWFPHNLNAHSDPKMQALLGEYGGVGYGVYWHIVELLHLNPTHKLPLKKYMFSAIAKQMSANGKQMLGKIKQEVIFPDEVQNFIKDCIDEYDLFLSDETHFWSNRVIRNIDKRTKIAETRSKSGKQGAIAKQKQAIAKQT